MALQALAGDRVPARGEVVVHVGHGGAAQPRADVVPAQAPAGGVVARVEAVAGVVGEVDAVDERQLAVDADRLLVVAVERVLARVDLAADARVAREGAHGLAHLRAAGVKGRDRRPGPDEHAHVDALGQLREQRARRDGRLAAHELEVRRQVPAGDVDEVARALHAPRRSPAAPRAPSTSTSSEQPSRGGGSPAAHRPSSGGSSARSHPRRLSRRRCLADTAASIALPKAASARPTRGMAMAVPCPLGGGSSAPARLRRGGLEGSQQTPAARASRGARLRSVRHRGSGSRRSAPSRSAALRGPSKRSRG